MGKKDCKEETVANPPHLDNERSISSQLEIVRLLEAYSVATRAADVKVDEYMQIVTQKTQRTFDSNVRMYYSLFASGLIMLVIGISIALFSTEADSYQQIYSFVTLIAGLVIFLALIFINPMKGIRSLISNMVKLNVILGGYQRQISQADIIFRELMMNAKLVPLEEIQGTILSIQEIIDQTVDQIDRLFDDG